MTEQAQKQRRELDRAAMSINLLWRALAELKNPTTDYNRTELARIIAAHLEG